MIEMTVRTSLWLAAALPIALPIALSWLGCGGGAATCPKPSSADDVLITIEEHTEGGACRVVPAIGVPEIDINSSLHLRMNQEAIKKRMAVEDAMDSAQVAAITKRLELLQTITEARAAETEYLTKLIDELDTLDKPTLQKRVLAFGKLRRTFRDAVGEYAAFADAAKSDFLRPGTGDELIQKHLNEALKASSEMVEELSEITWRVEAQLAKGRGSVQLHVNNYDELEVQSVRRHDKLSPPLPDDVEKQLDTAVALSEQVNDMKEGKDSLGKAVVEQLKTQFESLIGGRIGEWEQAADETLDWTKGKDQLPASIKTEVERIERVVEEVRDLGTKCKLLRGLADGSVAVDTTLLARTGELYTCVDSVDTLLDTAPDELRTALSQTKQAMTKAGQKISSIPAAPDQLAQSLSRAVTESEPWKRATKFIKDQRKNIDKPTWQSLALKDRSVDELVDGDIELMRSPREVDDLIHLRASVVENGVVAQVGVARSMRVVSSGLRVDVSPALIFVQSFDRGAAVDPFRATPAVAATLHYRAWRGDGKNHGNRLWNFLDMGIGIHLAYPDLGVNAVDANGNVISTDPSAEIGVGGTIHFFGDLLQGGIGYDLQVEQTYWFVGIGVQRLTDFGISVPTGGS